MSPIKPAPSSPPLVNPVDPADPADLPALICGACSLIFAKGGWLWEAEHPSEAIGICQCIIPHDEPENPAADN